MTAQIQSLLDDNEGQLPTYAWPGGYPLYFICADNEVSCPKCAEHFTYDNIEYTCGCECHTDSNQLEENK